MGVVVKHRDLTAKLKSCGWYLLRQGGRHEIWTNGDVEEPIPRHREINEMLAKKILKKAEANPKRGD